MRVLYQLLIFIFLLLFTATATQAQKPKAPESFEVRADESAEPFHYDGLKRVETRTGAVRSWSSLQVPVSGSTPEQQARQFLSNYSKTLNLQRADLSDLEHLETLRTLRGHTVRFQQHVQGVPVLNTRIAVSINRQNEVTFVASDYHPDVSVNNVSPSLSASQARSISQNRLNLQGNLNFDETDLVIYYNRGTSRLVYRTRMVPKTAPHGDWEVLADANTGQVYSVRDRAAYHKDIKKKRKAQAIAPYALPMRVDGTGNVFDPDPLSSAMTTYGTGGFTDGGDATNADLDGERFNVTLLDIMEASGNFTLIGPFAEIVDTEAPNNGLYTQAGSVFNFNRNDDAFEAVNTYYHIDKYMRYLNNTLGLAITPTQYAGGVRFDPHGLSGADNSHYISSTGEVAFGEGGVDDAEDADVVIHELGHGLHDWAAGTISQSNGLSEGIGDWTASSYSHVLGQWGPGDMQYNWVFDWDGHNEFWAGRLSNWNDTNTWPAGTGGGCLHTCGQYWSSSIVDISEAIGRDQAERAHWEGVKMTGGSATHEDAVAAVIQAAVDMSFPTSEVTAICDAFDYTGYFNTSTPPSACLSVLAITMTAAPDPVEAGENLTFSISVSNTTGSTLNGVTVTDPLPTPSLAGGAVTYVSDTCGGGEAGGTWTWNIGTMPDADVQNCDLVVQLPATPFSSIDFEDNMDTAANWMHGGTGDTWTLTTDGTGPDGGTQPPSPGSGGNRWFGQDVAGVTDQYLDLNMDVNPSGTAALEIWHAYDMESDFDGGVIEVSTDGGSNWTDVVAAGGVFNANGYDGTISGSFGSPIGGREAFTGDSGGWILTSIDVSGVSLSLVPMRFRFRLATDSSVDANGWWIDDIAVIAPVRLCNTATVNTQTGQMAQAMVDPCPLVTGPLPVELTAFDGYATQNGIVLEWATATETNNAGFAVEHLTNGVFREVGFVEGAGTTVEPKQYSFRVDKPGVGTQVFRLKQVDFDGTFEYSQRVEVDLAVPNGYELSSVYPNPFNPTTTFNLVVAREQNVAVSVYDMQGRKIQTLYSGALTANDQHRFSFEAGTLPSGLYVIRVAGESFNDARKVMLLK